MKNKGKSWSVGIFIFYVVFMVVLVGAVFYSTQNNVELVTPNYYEKTLKYDNQIEAIKNTRSLIKKPLFSVNKRKEYIFLQMPEIFSSGETVGEILFFRPSDRM